MSAAIREARKLVAFELKSLLRVRRSVRKLRRDTHVHNASEQVQTILGRMSRGQVLATSEDLFALYVKRVCLARRALFIEVEAGEPAFTVR